jgi:cell wall-associated NlpC family hydrolase
MSGGRREFLKWAAAGLGTACAGSPRSKTPPHPAASYPHVKRSEAIHTAEAYRTHRWMAGAENVLHAPDADGIRVDTPDIGYRRPGAVPGWWVPGQWNEGVPYQWGGFSALGEFDTGVARGLAAGDVYTLEKRALLEDGVSRHAVGIDCSGFISRCWKLPRPFSTREMHTICERLPSWDALLPGDILNTYNAHCLLFAGWADEARSRMWAYETGIPPHWKVIRHRPDTRGLRDKGFVPLRYRNMV